MSIRTFADDRRIDERNECNLTFRIYSSIASGAYTVSVKNISLNGAFIKSKYLPAVGEIITFEIYDQMEKTVFVGNADVRWLKDKVTVDEKGFGISFHDQIEPEVFENVLGS